MKNLIIDEFVDWYLENRENKGSNYLKNNFKNDVALFKNKLLEINEEFDNSYHIKPFNFDLKNLEISQIEELERLLKLKDDDFNVYNKKTGNGIPKAILGKRNFLSFLSDSMDEKEEKSEKHSSFFMRKEFVTYLNSEQDFSMGSAKSYASYVASSHINVLKNHLKCDFFGLIGSFFKNDNDIELEDFLDNSIMLIKKFSDPATKNKYSAGLTEYKYFLKDISENPYDNEAYVPDYVKLQIEDEDKRKATEVVDFVEYLENSNDFGFDYQTKFEIDRDLLFANFKFRLITQDRLYGDVYFPIRLLKKIFYKYNGKQIFDQFISDQINNIRIYTSNNKSFTILKNIDCLTIDVNNQVKFTSNSNGDDFILTGFVYTELGEEGKYDLFKADNLRQIAIDHIFTMKDVLMLHKNQLHGLLKLTNLLKERGLTKSGKEAIKQLASIGNQILEEEILNENDIQLISNDLMYLSNQLHLQLMSSAENLKKKNRS